MTDSKVNNKRTDEPDQEAVEAVLDVLLLGIIRAHPYKDKTLINEGTRLRSAKKALFGISPARGNPVQDDMPELLHMAKNFIKERGKPEYSTNYDVNWSTDDKHCSLVIHLASKAMAARKFFDPSHTYYNEEEKIKNLKIKFNCNIQNWLKMAHNQDGLAEDVFTLKTRELKELLAPLGIRIEEFSQSSWYLNSPI